MMEWVVRARLDGQQVFLTEGDMWSRRAEHARVFASKLLADLNTARHGRGEVVERDTAVWESVL